MIKFTLTKSLFVMKRLLSFAASMLFLIGSMDATVYYLKSGQSMTVLASWGTNTDGTGTAPTSFIGTHTWNVHNNANVTLAATFGVSGTAIVNIGNGTSACNFLYTGGLAKFGTTTPPTVNVMANAVFTLDQLFVGFSAVKTNHLTNSTFVVTANADQIPGDTYYNLTVGGSIYLGGPCTVQGVFDVTAGNLLDPDVNMLTLSGTIGSSGGTILGNNYGAGITMAGTGNMGSLAFFPGTEMLTNLTVNMGSSASSFVLATDFMVDGGACIMTQGGMDLAGFDFTVTSNAASSFAGNGGTFIGDANSNIHILSPAASGNIMMDATQNSIRSLNLDNSGQSLTIGNTMNLLDSVKINGTSLNANGNLILNATASLKARIAEITGGGSISGNITAQVFAPGGTTDWAVLGAGGVSGMTMNDWYDDFPMTIEGSATGPTSASGYFESVQGWDEGDAYGYDSTMTISTALTPGVGFWVFLGTSLGTTGAITMDLTGPAVTGNVNIPLTNSAQSGFNLIANPYPSPISWAKLRNGNASVSNAIYIYNADLGITTSYVNGVSTPASSSANDDIPMGQGFYVECSGNTNLTAQESNKVSNNTSADPLLRSTNASNINASVGSVIRLNIDGGGYHDDAAIRFHGSATNNYDMELDAKKLYDSPGYLGYPGAWTKRTAIATQLNNKDYSINSIPYAHTQNAVLPVVAKVYTTGSYTISASDLQNIPSNVCVSLFDKVTSITHDLRMSNYVCNISDTTNAARFVLTVCPDGLTTNVHTISAANNNIGISKDMNGVFVSFDYDVPVDATISVTNILGQTIMTPKKVKAAKETTYLNINTNDQLIFVTVETANNRVTKKILNK
jgi:hypothetical protein